MMVKLLDGSKVLYYASVTGTNYKYDHNQIPISINGTKTLTVELAGKCVPTRPLYYYSGYYEYLYFYVLEYSTATWTIKGKGCGSPKLGPPSTTVPKPGYFSINLTNAPANTPILALFGTSDKYFWFLKLPIDLSYMGATGCYLQVGFRYPYGRKTDSQGNASWRFYISNYYSGTYYFQWVVYDPKAPGGIYLTKYGELKF